MGGQTPILHLISLTLPSQEPLQSDVCPLGHLWMRAFLFV